MENIRLVDNFKLRNIKSLSIIEGQSDENRIKVFIVNENIGF